MASYQGEDSLSSSSSDSDEPDANKGKFEEHTGTIAIASYQGEDSLSSSSSDSDEPHTKKAKFEEGGDGVYEPETSHSSHSMAELQKKGNYSTFSSKMMAKMGYKPGKGLGASDQGRADIIPMSTQRARRGLGLTVKALNTDIIVDWEEEKPPTSVEEVEWMPVYDAPIPDLEELEGWMQTGKKKLEIGDETTFCDEKILQTMLACKSVFDDLEGNEMRNARTRSNAYETIKGVIFLNRAAMKMANMDHCFDYMFTRPKNLGPMEQLYFADICAGPGGFSEYVLWRKKWKAKGFGFTLKGENDFKLEKFYAANPEFFETHYGVGGKNGDGDIMKSANMEEFQNFVLDNTDGGVHFVMADGGFSVEGQENIQEILTKQLLLCQFACALSILRPEGNFVCKTFDLFTPFSVGLVYLLRMAFRRISIFKPVTSRPANSERYVVCEGYRDPDRTIYEYMIGLNDTMNELKKDTDVKEVVPLEFLADDKEFFNYFKSSNERIAIEQSKSLAKIHAFAKNRELIELRQHEIRSECLKLWGIPNDVRVGPPRSDAAMTFQRLTGAGDPTALAGFEPEFLTSKTLPKLERVYDYRCYPSGSRSSLIISLGGARVFRWDERFRKWNNLSNLRCKIPRDTILDVEMVQELMGEGKGQHKVLSLHVIDALFLAGDNVMSKNLNERLQCASMFVKAIRQLTCPNLTVVRAKEIYRMEELQLLFERITLKTIKGSGGLKRPCYEIPDTNLSFVPTGVTFVKFTKDPWSIAFSKSQRRKYFYNCETQKSSYECPHDANAPYKFCSRTFWKFDDGVKVHPTQQHRRADLVSSDQILNFIDTRCAT